MKSWRPYSLYAAWFAALAASAVLALRGAWSGFGRLFAPAPRWAYMAGALGPAALVYASVLVSGIFLGLRRCRKGAR
ncbi:MAG: hypothetical protein ABSG79_03080 [Bryobacteraceae bacterium]|jgi:uncharacterized membrane protein YdcZ (DUF606 family)